jgi:transcriptional regulator with XRE-family HTH domain/cell division septum initiation protein DivIVA
MSSSTADEGVALGRRIVNARRELGLTQADLATKIGVSLRAMDRYETGIVDPTPEVLQLVADATGVPVSRLTSTPIADATGDGTPLVADSSKSSGADADQPDLVGRISGAVGEPAFSQWRGDGRGEDGDMHVLRRVEHDDLEDGLDEGGPMSDTRPAKAWSAAEASQSALPAPPLDIRHEDLPKKTLGYSPKATAQLFDQVADAYTRLWEDRAALKQKVEELEVQLLGMPEPVAGTSSPAAEAKLEEAEASRRQLALQLEQSAGALSTARQEISRLSFRITELEGELESSGERRAEDLERADQAEAAVEHYREQERLIGEILVSARRNSSEIEQTAQREAERIRRDAQREANAILSETEREMERLAGERQRLEALASEVQEDLSAFLLGALERVAGHEPTPPEPEQQPEPPQGEPESESGAAPPEPEREPAASAAGAAIEGAPTDAERSSL